MDESLQEDCLDARLREEAAYIDDGGFTLRVVRKLPAHRVRHSLRAVILLGVTLVASAIAYLLSGGGWFIAEGVTRFALLPLPVIWLCAAGATVLVMAGGLAAAMSKTGGSLR
jgi:anti-sigma factor RsiW